MDISIGTAKSIVRKHYPDPLNLQIYKNKTNTCEGGDSEANSHSKRRAHWLRMKCIRLFDFDF